MKPKRVTSTFVLKNPKEKETLIFLVVRIQGQQKRLKFSTGQYINPKHWDVKEKRARLSSANSDTFLRDELLQLNKDLDEYYKTFRRADLELQESEKDPILEYYRNKLVEKYGGRSDSRIIYLMDFLDKYIDTANVRDTTKSAYRVAKGTFKEYEAFTGSRISFDTFRTAQFDNFVQWMQTEKKFAKNTMGARTKNLKVFFQKAYEYGHHTNDVYRRFKTVQEDSVQIALKEEEVQKLWEKDLSSDKRLETIRDLFIIGCRTALRFEDWGRIKPEMIDYKEKKIRITTSKTMRFVVIPLHWQVVDILKRHNNELPRVPSNQKFNKFIKELCKLVKIDDPEMITRTIAGEKVTDSYKRHELVSSHTARRTAATLMYLAGIPVLDIMKITGHKTEKAFLKYIKISEEEAATRMLESDYYKDPLRIAK